MLGAASLQRHWDSDTALRTPYTCETNRLRMSEFDLEIDRARPALYLRSVLELLLEVVSESQSVFHILSVSNEMGLSIPIRSYWLRPYLAGVQVGCFQYSFPISE